jgi:flagellin
VINGIAIDSAAVAASDTASSAAKASSAISTAAAINAKSDQTGVSAVVGETQVGGNNDGRCTAPPLDPSH